MVGANIIGTKLIKDGFLIHCDNDISRDKLNEEIKQKFGESYNVTLPKKRNPRIIIYGIDPLELEKGDFVGNLINGNHLNATAGDVKFVTKIKYKNTINVILEVAPFIFRNVMNKRFLFVGWSRHNIDEHFSIIKCFKCCKIGHKKNNCQSKVVVCPNCAGDHDLRSCNRLTKCCVNCTYMNNNLKNKVPTDHVANSSNCSYFINRVDAIRKETNYE